MCWCFHCPRGRKGLNSGSCSEELLVGFPEGRCVFSSSSFELLSLYRDRRGWLMLVSVFLQTVAGGSVLHRRED